MNRWFALRGRVRAVSLAFLDAAAWWMALGMAMATTMSIDGGQLRWNSLLVLATLAALVQISNDLAHRLSLGAYRIGSVDEARGVVKAWGVTSIALVVVDLAAFGRPIPVMALLTSLPLALSGMLGARFAWRLLQDRLRRPQLDHRSKRVLVFGAGEGAEQIVRSMMRDPKSGYVPVALLDDDRSKRHRRIEGVLVGGTRNDISQVARLYRAQILLIAIPSANADLISELDELGQRAGLEVRVLPSTTELVGMLSTADIRELTDADILGRDEIDVDMESIRRYLTEKRVLVTGAGGSIGRELCRQLAKLDCESLIMVDRDESGLHGTQLIIEGRALLDDRSIVVADIRDRERVFEVFAEHRPQVVFHAAALKHLTLLEQYPEEGRKTNVEGSRNVLDAAEHVGVCCYVNVSTDKAADATSVLGRTKLEAERLTAAKAETTKARFVSVRFGNVLGSRGSVLPVFRHQIAQGGPVTITDPDVTRYFMTIPEAVRLVLQAGAIGRPGEVMILDMGKPVKIVDLATRLIKHFGSDVDIVFTGLRPGEKKHEILVSQFEVAVTREHGRIMHAYPSAESSGSPVVRAAQN